MTPGKPLVSERVRRPIRVRPLVIAELDQLKIVNAPVHHVHSSDKQHGPAQLRRLPLPGRHVVLRNVIIIGQDIHVSGETSQDQIRMPRLAGRSTQPGPHAIRDVIWRHRHGTHLPRDSRNLVEPARPAQAPRSYATATRREVAGDELQEEIAAALRDEDDWSIEWTGCGCDLNPRGISTDSARAVRGQ